MDMKDKTVRNNPDEYIKRGDNVPGANLTYKEKLRLFKGDNMRIEIMNQALRRKIFGVFVSHGIVGPPYGLDDINPFVSKTLNTIHIYFYDMSTYLRRAENPALYDELSDLLKGEE